ncbi:uncharacterized protein LOC124894534 [Capsicum annuum]|uniref:uncharacterized protein LOC124894534 n=1 Tax=Capsicum annuum TaxID=4072 RepID=UPI001FB0518D|nr:uncharacterized protein LOC124894534 [Capsicum annuum]
MSKLIHFWFFLIGVNCFFREMTRWILWKKKSMLPSKNSKELHSTDQLELEAGNVADQKVNNTADEKAEAAADGKIEAATDEKVDAAADGKGDAAVDGEVFTPSPVGFVLDKPWCRLISEYPEVLD